MASEILITRSRTKSVSVSHFNLPIPEITKTRSHKRKSSQGKGKRRKSGSRIKSSAVSFQSPPLNCSLSDGSKPLSSTPILPSTSQLPSSSISPPSYRKVKLRSRSKQHLLSKYAFAIPPSYSDSSLMARDEAPILTAQASYDLKSSSLPSFFSSLGKSQPSSAFGTDCFQLLCAPLSLEKILLVFHNAFEFYRDSPSFGEELTLFFFSYGRYISTSDLLHYFFFKYIPGISECEADEMTKLRFTLPAFIQSFLSLWLSVDPRLRPHSHEIISLIVTNKNGLSIHSFKELFPLLLEDNQLASSSIPNPALSALAFEERTGYHQMFFKTSPSQAAAFLHTAHLNFYCKVWPWDLFSFSTGSASTEIESLISAVPDHFNKTVAWIQTSCLKPDSARSRVKKIVYWIAIAEAATELNFLSVILMIMTALNHHAVTRLKQTWELLPPASLSIFQSLLPLTQAQNNYQILRKQAHKFKCPLPLAILSKDLTILLEILRSPSKPMNLEEIPYRDLRQVAITIYRAFLPSVNPTPEVAPPANLLSFLHDPLPRLLIDRLFQLSYAHEPPPKQLDPEIVVTNPLLRARK